MIIRNLDGLYLALHPVAGRATPCPFSTSGSGFLVPIPYAAAYQYGGYVGVAVLAAHVGDPEAAAMPFFGPEV